MWRPPENPNPPPSVYSSGFPEPNAPPPHHHLHHHQYAPPTGPPPPHSGTRGAYGGYDRAYRPPSGPPPPLENSRPYPTNHFSPPPGPPPPMHYGPPPGPPPQGSYAPPDYGQMHYQPSYEADWYQYSECTGRRKALCIGINYYGTSNELKGCWNDAENMKRFLIERYNFREEDMVILMDKPGTDYGSLPLRENMIRAMHWLVRDAQPHDSLFFHYSGHGGQTEDLDGDKYDGYDDVIYPLDFKETSHIVDDEIHDILVKPLPAGCRLTAVFDSCHSGTVMDLPYTYSTKGKIKEPNMLAEVGQGAMGLLGEYTKGDYSGMFSTLKTVGMKVMNGNKAEQITRQTKSSPADVILWSGCKDDQTSADTEQAGQATGAMSWAFIASLTKYPQQSYIQMLNTIRDELRGRYSQKPQLSASHPIDTNLMFII